MVSKDQSNLHHLHLIHKNNIYNDGVRHKLPTTKVTVPIMKGNRKHQKEMHCLEEGCGHKRVSTADMVQCSHCAMWHHLDCVGLHQSDSIGVCPCSRCRVQTDLLHQCHRMLQEISSELAALKLLQDNAHKDMGSLARAKKPGEIESGSG